MGYSSLFYVFSTCLITAWVILLTSHTVDAVLDPTLCDYLPKELCTERRIKTVCRNNCGKFTKIENETASTRSTKLVLEIRNLTTPSPLEKKSLEIQTHNKKSPEANSKAHFISTNDHEGDSAENYIDEEDLENFFNPTETTGETTTIPPTTLPASGCDKITPCINISDANAQFRQRCLTMQPPMNPACADFCHYDVSLADLRFAFTRGICPVGEARLYLRAASAERDNTKCCAATGILAGRRDICFPFCNANSPAWPDRRSSIKYLVCMQVLEPIMRCHWAGLE